LEYSANITNSIRSLIVNIAILVLIVLLGYNLSDSVLQNTFKVIVSSVPKPLEDLGYTKESIKGRVSTEMLQIQSAIDKQYFGISESTGYYKPIDLTIPDSSLTFETVTSYLRPFFGYQDMVVKFTLTQQDHLYSVHPRFLLTPPFPTDEVVTSDTLNELIAKTAKSIFRQINPLALVFYELEIVKISNCDVEKNCDYEAAIDEINRYFDKFPDTALAWYLKANAYRHIDFDISLYAYESYIELNPNNSDGYYRLGELFEANGKLREAERSFRKSIEVDGMNSVAHKVLGYFLTRKNQIQEAISVLQKAVELAPKDAQAHTYLGDALFMNAQKNEGINSFRKALDLDKGDVEIHQHLIKMLVSNSQVNDALTESQKALRNRSYTSQDYKDLVLIFIDNNHYTEGISFLRKIIKLNKGDAQLHLTLVYALLKNSQVDDAEMETEIAGKSKSYSALNFVDLGLLWSDMANFDKAEFYIRRAIALSPNDVHARTVLGSVLMKTDQFEMAIKSFQSALELSPKIADSHFNMGLALIRSNQYDEGIAALRNAIALAPENARYYAALGQKYVKGGQLHEGIFAFRQAIELDPHDIGFYIHLSQTLYQTGQHDESIDVYRTVVEMEPENEEFKQMLDSLLAEIEQYSGS
jgi:tetratricopeptide (TPR) repeat protein